MNNEINKIEIFRNPDFGELTVMEKDGEFFFLAKQVAEMLGYVRPDNAIRTHVAEEDKLTHPISASGQRRWQYWINESGLYSLILSSSLPGAKKFKQWVTKDVLPSIRRNGGYIYDQENMTDEEIMANALILANNLIQEKERKIQELTPKAQYFDKLVDQNLLTNFRNTAKELHIPQNMFIRFLMERKFIYRDKKGRLLPYAEKNRGYFEVKEWHNKDNELVGIQTLITAKGRQFLMLLLEREGVYWKDE